MRYILPALAFLSVPPAAFAAPPPVVLELFTSQSCSSCPPADAFLAELAGAEPNVLALDFHVDYWNYLSWHDPFSSADATRRQQDYSARLGAEVYTPQIVVNGQTAMVGSDRAAVKFALEQARGAADAGVKLAATQSDGGVDIQVTAGKSGGTKGATLLLIGYDPEHVTRVQAGENGGRTLREVNVVRSIQRVGAWNGTDVNLHAKLGAGARAAVLLQADNGHILSAATL